MSKHFRQRSFVLVLLAAPTMLGAQVTPSKSLIGTVNGFKVNAHEMAILVTPDSGATSALPFGPETDVIRVSPGQHDLSKGEPARMTEVVPGDRVLVSFVHGMTEARRIVLITATDIEKRNEAYRQDWQARGIGGVVTSTKANQVMLRTGQQTVTVNTSDRTIIRRYAPDSVKFADAGFSNVGQIATGDQLQVRGDKSADGSSMTAQEVVFGTFLTTAGKITQVNRETNRVTIQDLAKNEPVTIKLTGDSRLRMVPDMQTIMNHMHGGGSASGSAGPPHALGPGGCGMVQMIDMLPAARIQELKPGQTVVVTSTRGSSSNEVTAILFLANADFVVQMMQAAAPGAHQANGTPNMEEILRRHGTAPGGGFNVPAIIP